MPLVDYLKTMFVFEGHDELLGLIPQTVLIQHYVSLRLLLKQLVVHVFLLKHLAVTVDLTFFHGGYLTDLCMHRLLHSSRSLSCFSDLRYATYNHHVQSPRRLYMHPRSQNSLLVCNNWLGLWIIFFSFSV